MSQDFFQQSNQKSQHLFLHAPGNIGTASYCDQPNEVLMNHFAVQPD